MNMKVDEVDEIESEEVEDLDAELETDEEEVEDEVLSESDEESEESDGENDSEKSDEDDDEISITIGDSPTPDSEKEEAPEWVKEIRKSNRRLNAENERLKKEVESLKSPKPKTIEVGPKPKLSDDSIDYDESKYEQALDAWHERKRKADQQVEDEKAQQAEESKAWQNTLNSYNEAKQSLGVKNFDDSEALVIDTLNETQQGIIVHGAKDAETAAALIYALGRSDELEKLAKIKDPVKFAFAVSKIEDKLNVKKRTAPPPEKTVKSPGSKNPGSKDSHLDKLRAKAEKTGDYTEINRYKRKMKQSKT